jgi:shikimate kinase
MRILWLIGLMGSGKTVVGKLVSRRTGLPLIDTDERLAAEHGQTITSLWDSLGEEAFRELEVAQIAAIVASGRDCVVATGGGAVVRPENVTAMRDNGVVVWLTALPEVLSTRIGNGLTRPLLSGRPIERRLAALLTDRHPHYAAAAHRTVDTSDKNPDEVAREVILLWNAS